MLRPPPERAAAWIADGASCPVFRFDGLLEGRRLEADLGRPRVMAIVDVAPGRAAIDTGAAIVRVHDVAATGGAVEFRGALRRPAAAGSGENSV